SPRRGLPLVFIFWHLAKPMGPQCRRAGPTRPGGNYKLRATPPLLRSRWRHTCHKVLVTDSAFGARGDLVYSGAAVEIAGLRSLLRLSSAGERSLHTGEVVGSIPTAPTIAAAPWHLQPLGRQRIALRNLSRIEPLEEPALALFGTTVRERVGHDIALRFFLQAGVADRRRPLQGLVEVARIGKLVLLLRTGGPHAGETIGLQLDSDLQSIGLGLARSCLLRLHHARQDTELILHVMSDFMRNDVGFRKPAGTRVRAGAEFTLHILEERCVQIDPLIAR